MKVGLTLAAAALALATLSSSAKAVPLIPDSSALADSVVLSPTAVIIADTGALPFAGGPASPTVPFTGTYRFQVLNEGATNTLGGLTFVYDFTNSGPNTIRRLSSNNFDGFLTNVSYDGAGPLPGGPVAPISVDRGTGGGVVGFNFNQTGGQAGVVAGSGSSLLVIRTNAQAIRFNNVSIIDGGTADLVGFAAAVPEPGTMAAALVGLVAVGGYRLRRRVK